MCLSRRNQPNCEPRLRLILWMWKIRFDSSACKNHCLSREGGFMEFSHPPLSHPCQKPSVQRFWRQPLTKGPKILRMRHILNLNFILETRKFRIHLLLSTLLYIYFEQCNYLAYQKCQFVGSSVVALVKKGSQITSNFLLLQLKHESIHGLFYQLHDCLYQTTSTS